MQLHAESGSAPGPRDQNPPSPRPSLRERGKKGEEQAAKGGEKGRGEREGNGRKREGAGEDGVAISGGPLKGPDGVGYRFPGSSHPEHRSHEAWG